MVQSQRIFIHLHYKVREDTAAGSIAIRGFLCFHYFLMVHPIPTSPLNDFALVPPMFVWFMYKHSDVRAYMCRLVVRLDHMLLQ